MLENYALGFYINLEFARAFHCSRRHAWRGYGFQSTPTEMIIVYEC